MQLKYLGLTVAIAAGALSSNMAFGQSAKFSYVNNFSTQAEIDDFYKSDWIWDTEDGVYCGATTAETGALSSDLISVTPGSRRELEFSFKGFAIPGEPSSTGLPSLAATALLYSPNAPPVSFSLSCEEYESGEATSCYVFIDYNDGNTHGHGNSIGFMPLDQMTELKLILTPEPKGSSDFPKFRMILVANSVKHPFGDHYVTSNEMNTLFPKTTNQVQFTYQGGYFEPLLEDMTGSTCIDKISLQVK
jgi:hypothetical protein